MNNQPSSQQEISKDVFFSTAISFRGLVFAADINGDVYCILRECAKLLKTRPRNIPHGVPPARMVCSDCDRFLFVVYGFNWLVRIDPLHESSRVASVPSDEFILGMDANANGEVVVMTQHTLRRYEARLDSLTQVQEIKQLPFTKQPPFTKRNNVWVFQGCTIVQGQDAWFMRVAHDSPAAECQVFDCDPENPTTSKSIPHSVVKHEQRLYVGTQNAVYVFDALQADFKPIYIHACANLVSFGIFDMFFNLTIVDPYVCLVHDNDFEACVYRQSLKDFENEAATQNPVLDGGSKRLIAKCDVSEGERVLCLADDLAIVSKDDNSVRLIKVKNQEVWNKRVVHNVKCVVPYANGDKWQGIVDGNFQVI